MEQDMTGDNTEKLLILPLSEESRQVTQTLSNEKALKILELLAQEPMSATSIADSLDLPLTTVKYNLDSLIEADLIQVKDTRWSRKGREIKIYEPVQKMIVVMPGTKRPDKSSVLDMLKKYLALGAGAIFAAAGIESLNGFSRQPLMGASEMRVMDESLPEMAFMANESEMGAAADVAAEEEFNITMVSPAMEEEVLEEAMIPQSDAASMSMADSVADGGTQFIPDLLSHVSVWFLIGCLSVLTILAVWEIYKRKKRIDGQK
ncbi:DNA-binding transcriptional ArsR family regulator [Methanohalophilus levihalophilus]|uniref:ArsR/SmtB family transcription factor n=1 Tax=Methanohalophilus levihalophilus TaxID=1431282 RepID=UPI001FD9C04E|nr:winged helix-turn-helix domain-containing protein [Methanohalophilus levihalophilus]MBP2029940.1 DNA-binding transcriptional ArsR family regulator [Methanohalophilus levihalophilus]